MMSQVVLDHFTRYFGLDHDDIVQVLESSVPSDAYLATLDTPVEKLPRASDHPISSLFTFCSVVRMIRLPRRRLTRC